MRSHQALLCSDLPGCAGTSEHSWARCNRSILCISPAAGSLWILSVMAPKSILVLIIFIYFFVIKMHVHSIAEFPLSLALCLAK